MTLCRKRRNLQVSFAVAIIAFLWVHVDSQSIVSEALFSFRLQILLLGPIGILGFSGRARALGTVIMLFVSAKYLMELEQVHARSIASLKMSNGPSESPSITLASLNVLGRTVSPEKLNDALQKIQANVVVLEEYEARFNTIEELKKFPFKIEKLSIPDFGIAVFSNFPVRDITAN